MKFLIFWREGIKTVALNLVLAFKVCALLGHFLVPYFLLYDVTRRFPFANQRFFLLDFFCAFGDAKSEKHYSLLLKLFWSLNRPEVNCLFEFYHA